MLRLFYQGEVEGIEISIRIATDLEPDILKMGCESHINPPLMTRRNNIPKRLRL
jgi:hypothetical protein